MISIPWHRWSWHAWRHHLVTNILVAFFFFLVLRAGETLHAPFLEDMERWGQDAAMRVFAARVPTEGPKVVLVNVNTDRDGEADATDLANLLGQIRDARPKAVLVDVTLEHSAERKRVHHLIDVLASSGWGSTVVAIPVENEALAQGIAGLGWVRAAAPELKTDDDGVVRRTYESACTAGSVEGNRYLRPTLSAALLTQASTPLLGCDEKASIPSRTVLFGRERNRPDSPGRGVLLLPSQAVPSHTESLRDAYVVVGHASAGEDAFVTPVGLMSGARVHAAAVWTWASDDIRLGWHAWCVMALLEIVSWVLLGAVSAAYTTWFGQDLPSAHLEKQSFLLVFRRFIVQGLGGMTIVVGALSAVIWFWTWVAAYLVGGGLFVGTVVPAFGALLEALAHAGRHVVDLAEWLASRGLDRLTRNRGARLLSLAAAFALVAHPAAAESPAACTSHLLHIIDGGALADLLIEPGKRHVSNLSQPLELGQEDEIVVLNARTTAVVEQVFWGETKITRLRGPDAMVLLPCPPSRESWTGWWQAFWSARNLHAELPSRPGTIPARSVSLGKPYLRGRLRELTNLASADEVAVGARGFAFAWAGGNPPYEVEMKDAASDVPLAGGAFKTPEVWWPDWQTPSAPFTVVVRDAEGVELSRTFRLLSPSSVRDDTASAIKLFETAPSERMEVLRRLRRVADADPLAQRAYEKVHVDGAGE